MKMFHVKHLTESGKSSAGVRGVINSGELAGRLRISALTRKGSRSMTGEGVLGEQDELRPKRGSKMESNILNSLGIDPGIIVIAMMGIMIFVLLYMVRVSMKMTRFMKRYRIFMRGKDAESMENMSVEKMRYHLKKLSHSVFRK